MECIGTSWSDPGPPVMGAQALCWLLLGLAVAILLSHPWNAYSLYFEYCATSNTSCLGEADDYFVSQECIEAHRRASPFALPGLPSVNVRGWDFWRNKQKQHSNVRCRVHPASRPCWAHAGMGGNAYYCGKACLSWRSSHVPVQLPFKQLGCGSLSEHRSTSIIQV